MAKFESPNGLPIVGILETVPCLVGVESVADDGSSFQYNGNGSTLYWDDQKPVKRNGSFVFIDLDGGEWTFNQIIRFSEE